MTMHIRTEINSKIIKNLFLIVIMLIFSFILSHNVYAVSSHNNNGMLSGESRYYNEITGYRVIIEDDANLLSDYEEEKLLARMKNITEYGSVAFKTINENNMSTKYYIKEYYYNKFKVSSAIVFLIDMDNRNIWIHSNGDIYNVITSDYADIITDNVYKYASDREYFECADRAFEQIFALLEGKEIAHPMKYICNILLALVVSFLINYIIVISISKMKKAKDKELMEYINHNYEFSTPRLEYVCSTEKYSPQSSGGSRSSGSRGSGSRGGGGGGGHSF